jgi:choline dehydrogenase
MTVSRARTASISAFNPRHALCVAYARREVVLCGGAVNSPQLLMLSGIGDRDHLVDHGIDVVYHSPEVGQNLLDHLTTRLGFAVEGGSLFAGEKPK